MASKSIAFNGFTWTVWDEITALLTGRLDIGPEMKAAVTSYSQNASRLNKSALMYLLPV